MVTVGSSVVIDSCIQEHTSPCGITAMVQMVVESEVAAHGVKLNAMLDTECVMSNEVLLQTSEPPADQSQGLVLQVARHNPARLHPPASSQAAQHVPCPEGDSLLGH